MSDVAIRRAFLLLAITSAFAFRLSAQSFSAGAFIDTSKTQDEYILRNLKRFITPEYLRRHDRMRLIQRTGYSSMLLNVVDRDALRAVIDYIRMSLHLDYSQNLGPVYYPSQTRVWFELPIDRKFPADPWKKVWWQQ